MQTNLSKLKINWSVWDNNPIVTWVYDGKTASVVFKLVPVAVANISSRKMIAIVGNFDEFGSSNLFVYSYDGVLQHTYTAPNLGKNSQFGGVMENGADVDVIVGFKTDSIWKEEAGKLDLNDGVVSGLHRNY
jgi:hypothetical protein